MPSIRAWPVFAPRRTRHCAVCNNKLIPPFIRCVGYAWRGEPIQTVDVCLVCAGRNVRDPKLQAALAEAQRMLAEGDVR